LAESKIRSDVIYRPGASTVEGSPTQLQVFLTHPPPMAMPHWHAQVEVNFILAGRVHYRMGDHEIALSAGEMCLFWGGQPHQMDQSSEDSRYAGCHLPLVCFFRLRLPAAITAKVMTGQTLVTSATDAADAANFERWTRYVQSGDAAQSAHAVDELLLRLERIAFEPFALVAADIHARVDRAAASTAASGSAHRGVARICDFIAGHFRDDIDAAAIAHAAGLHPKYAMKLFRDHTGMTIAKYVGLLRLSYAQALLSRGETNVLDVAMDSGFGSLSAFNKTFRDIAGTSPSDFRREARQFLGLAEAGGPPLP